MKRFVSLVLVLSTVFSLSVSSFAADKRYVPLIPTFVDTSGNGINVNVRIPVDTPNEQSFFANFYDSPYVILISQGTSSDYYPMSPTGDMQPEFVGSDKKWWIHFVEFFDSFVVDYYDPLLYPTFEPKPLRLRSLGTDFTACSYLYDFESKSFEGGVLQSLPVLQFSYVIGSASLSSPSALYPGYNMLKDINFVTTKADMPNGIDRHYDWWIGKKNITNNVTPPVDPPVDPPSSSDPDSSSSEPDPPSSSDPDYDDIKPDKPYNPFDPDNNNSGYEPPPYDNPFDDYDPTDNLPPVPNMPDFPKPPTDLPDGGDDPFKPPSLPDGGDDPFKPPSLPDGGDDPFKPPVLPDGGDDPFKPPVLPDGGDDPFKPPVLPDGGDDPFKPPASLPDFGYDPFQPPVDLPEVNGNRSWFNPFSSPVELPDIARDPFKAPSELPDVSYNPFEKPPDFPDVVYDPFSIPDYWRILFNL